MSKELNYMQEAAKMQPLFLLRKNAAFGAFYRILPIK